MLNIDMEFISWFSRFCRFNRTLSCRFAMLEPIKIGEYSLEFVDFLILFLIGYVTIRWLRHAIFGSADELERKIIENSNKVGIFKFFFFLICSNSVRGRRKSWLKSGRVERVQRPGGQAQLCCFQWKCEQLIFIVYSSKWKPQGFYFRYFSKRASIREGALTRKILYSIFNLRNLFSDLRRL